MNSNIATMDGLLKEKREKKKKAPTAQDTKQFREAWMDLINNEGFTERVERYLYDGFFFCGAEPFESYLCQAKEPNEVLISFFSGNMYGTNMSDTFRLLSHLLARLLNKHAPQNVLAPIIKCLPSASVNKENNRLGTAQKTMEKYFFAELGKDIELLPLEAIEIKSIFIIKFAEMMTSIIDGIKENAAVSDEYALNIAKAQAWIADYSKVSERLTISPAAKTEKNKAVDQAAQAQKILSTVIVPSLQNATSIEQSSESMDMNAYLMDLLKQVNKTASAINSENIQHKNKIMELTRSVRTEEEKLYHANQQLTEQQKLVSTLRQQLVAAETDIFALKQAVVKKDTILAEKEAEIAERTKMSELLSRDRSKQADEVLQRMASKIGVEYRDFQDAVAIPMNCDLGENLRLQLQSIFDILEKGGMKIK